MDYSKPFGIKLSGNIPLAGCVCSICENARKLGETHERPRTYSTPAYVPFDGKLPSGNTYANAEQLRQINNGYFNPGYNAGSEDAPEDEPVYTHVLVDYDEDGDQYSYCELHTTQSLVEAIALRSTEDQRFQVFELGRSILDVVP